MVAVEPCLGAGRTLESALVAALQESIPVRPIIQIVADFCACSGTASMPPMLYQAIFRDSTLRKYNPNDYASSIHRRLEERLPRHFFIAQRQIESVLRGRYCQLLMVTESAHSVTQHLFHGMLSPNGHWSEVHEAKDCEIPCPLIIVLCTTTLREELWSGTASVTHEFARTILAMQILTFPNSLQEVFDHLLSLAEFNSLEIIHWVSQVVPYSLQLNVH